MYRSWLYPTELPSHSLDIIQWIILREIQDTSECLSSVKLWGALFLETDLEVVEWVRFLPGTLRKDWAWWLWCLSGTLVLFHSCPGVDRCSCPQGKSAGRRSWCHRLPDIWNIWNQWWQFIDYMFRGTPLAIPFAQTNTVCCWQSFTHIP